MTMKKLFAVFGILAMMTACATTEEQAPQKFQESRFDAQQQINLKVNKVEVVSEFVPSFTRPNVEHLFPVSIEKTAMNWANDRLKAVDFSSNKQATFTVKDASVTEEIVKSEKLFEKDSIKYLAKLSVALKVSDPNKFSSAETSLNAWRELTIPVDTTIEQKEVYWKNMVDELFEKFNTHMQMNVNKHLNMYIEDNQFIAEYE
jgi:hypothetical protein